MTMSLLLLVHLTVRPAAQARFSVVQTERFSRQYIPEDDGEQWAMHPSLHPLERSAGRLFSSRPRQPATDGGDRAKRKLDSAPPAAVAVVGDRECWPVSPPLHRYTPRPGTVPTPSSASGWQPRPALRPGPAEGAALSFGRLSAGLVRPPACLLHFLMLLLPA